MGNWERIKLGEVCELKGGFAFKSKDFLVEGIPLIKISNIQNDKTVKTDSDVYISPRLLEYLQDVTLRKNDVVIAMSGATTGKIGKVTEEFTPSFLNQRVGLFKVRDNEKTESEIIYQIFSQDYIIKNILGNAGSSAQPNISPNFIENIQIYLPELKPEQTRIAEILRTADEAIEQTEKLIAKYQRIKTGLMQALLTRGIDEHGNIRSKTTHKFVVKSGIEVPNEWGVVEFGNKEYFDLATGGTPSTERKEYWEYGNIPWLSSGEVHKKEIFATDNFITELGYRNSNARFYPIDTILIALAGQGKTRGTVALNKIELTSNQSVAGIIPNKENIEPYFVFYYLELGYEMLRSISAGSGRAGLTLNIISSISIPLPDINEQKRIVKSLRQLETSIRSETAHLSKLHSIKTGLMQELLSGRVRVKMSEL